jgi:pimeloyl-ACP methyl ester carboxylesterase
MKSGVGNTISHARFLSFAFCLLTSVSLFTSACLLKNNSPNLPRNFPVRSALNHKGKNPVIVIPGVLGSQLVNRRTSEKVWPSLTDSEDDSLALPISSIEFGENNDDLVANEILETAKFGLLIPEISVYDSLVTALQNYGGYRRGNLDAPPDDGAQDTFYVFAYDWRRDNVESARLLARKITEVKEKLGKPDLRFDLIAHSMGGLVARYYAMYGDRDALSSAAPEPDWSGARNLNRLILMGTPNAGSMDALRTLLLGYSITETNRVRISFLSQLDRDSIFTTPSAYQLLPRNASARFLDGQLAPLNVDLFALETWRRYKWSAAYNVRLDKSERKKLKKESPDAVTAATEKLAAERERFLQAALARAKAFHRALDAISAPPESLRLYLYGGDCEDTLDAALIVTDQKTGQPLTLFQPSGAVGNRAQRRRAAKVMFVPGDGRVTRRSLFGLRLEPDAVEDGDDAPRAMKQQPFYAVFDCELHGDLPLNTRLQNNLLTMLLGNSY